MTEEIWKDIVGYEGRYQISNMGRVKSLRRKNVTAEKLVKGSLDTRGYPHIQLFKDGVMTCFKKHILVARTFVSNPESKRTVNHVNGIKTDNRADNLQWATDKENINHAIDSGLRKRAPAVRRKSSAEQRSHILSNAGMTINQLCSFHNLPYHIVWRLRQTKTSLSL